MSSVIGTSQKRPFRSPSSMSSSSTKWDSDQSPSRKISGVSFATSNWVTVGAVTFFNGQQALFSGNVDEVRFWDYPRTVQQIRDTMFRPLVGTEPGLVFYARLD